MTSTNPSQGAEASSDDAGLPTPTFPKSESRGGPPSIISSRMTDVGDEDAADSTNAAQPSVAAESKSAGATGRPSSARTGASSKGQQGQTTRKKSTTGRTNKRNSGLGQPTRPTPTPSSSRSHVPSLTSNAFFRPLSSQKLQAQRGGNRPLTITSPPIPQEENLDDNATDFGANVLRTPVGTPGAQIQRRPSDDHAPLPPSRGTEGTEQETYGRVTANTSPTHGHAATGSMSDSVRPLNKTDGSRNNLRVDVRKSHRELVGMPSPIKSPRSFRSSFLMAGKSEHEQSRNRSTEGAEKLASEASSPQANTFDSQGRPRKPAQQMQNGQNGRVHEYFEGNTRFLLGGRWQNTNQRPINIATGIFVLIPCVMFYVFDASWLWHNISPAIPITVAYLNFICVSSFIHASSSDPGILPRNLHRFPPADDNDPLRVGPPTNDWTMVKSADRRTAAMEVPVKHCRTCNVWRPPRAHHCRLCDNCIEGHDHHCVWLNNCVGKRNYRYFFTFVTSSTFLALYLIAASILQIVTWSNRENVSFVKGMDHFRGSFALVILAFLAFCYPAALMGYHIFLMARGETTREYMNSHKFVKSERYRPFSQRNIFKNIIAVLCRPRTPTYYQFKSKYRQGDQRLAIQRRRRGTKNSQGLEMQNVTPAGAGFQGPVSLRQEGHA